MEKQTQWNPLPGPGLAPGSDLEEPQWVMGGALPPPHTFCIHGQSWSQASIPHV